MGNHLICDCVSSFWLWNFVSSIRRTKTFELTAVCAYPAHLANKILLNLQFNDFVCGKYLKSNNSSSQLIFK